MRTRDSLLVVSALIVSLMSFSVIFWIGVASPGHGMDLNAYRIGAELLYTEHGLYASDKQLWWQLEAETGLSPVTGPYRYPIHLAWLLTALRDVSTETLWIANALLNWLAATLGAALVARALGGGILYPLSILLVGASGSLAETILLGQVSGYIFCFLCIAATSLQNSRMWPFALSVACGAALKVLPVILIPIAVAARFWRIAAMGSLATFAIFLLPVLFFGPEHLFQYFSGLTNILSLPGMGPNDHSIKASFFRLGINPGVADIVRLLLLALLADRLIRSLFMVNDPVHVLSLAALGIAASLLIPSTVFFTYHLYSLLPLLLVLDRLLRNQYRYLSLLLLGFYLVIQVAFFMPGILRRVARSLISQDTGAFDWLGVMPVCYALTLFFVSYFLCAPKTSEGS
jgi:hypothetical protein